MKQFRVGSISMGVAFVLLGIVLLLVQVFKLDIGYVLLSWWPVIFILLGAEMLIYLFKRNDNQLKFDFLSIIFVGIIGTAGIGMTVVSELGLVEMLKKEINMVYQEEELPSFEETLVGINKVVVDRNGYNIHFYSSTDNTLEAFGTMGGHWDKNEKIIVDASDYIVTRKSGDILFVTLKNINSSNHFNGGIYNRELTIVLPKDVEVEALGNPEDKIVFANEVETSN